MADRVVVWSRTWTLGPVGCLIGLLVIVAWVALLGAAVVAISCKTGGPCA